MIINVVFMLLTVSVPIVGHSYNEQFICSSRISPKDVTCIRPENSSIYCNPQHKT